MKWNSLCSTEGTSIQWLDFSGLELFDFAKGDFSMNRKGSKLTNANRRDFQTQNAETFFPHTVGWLCYKLLSSWSQQGCYLQSQCSPHPGLSFGHPEKLLALCKPWPSVTCHDSGIRAEVNRAFLPRHNRTWVWLRFCFGQERSVVEGTGEALVLLWLSLYPHSSVAYRRVLRAWAIWGRWVGNRSHGAAGRAHLPHSGELSRMAVRSPITRETNGPWLAADVCLGATFPNSFSDVRGVAPAAPFSTGGSLTSLAKEVQT